MTLESESAAEFREFRNSCGEYLVLTLTLVLHGFGINDKFLLSQLFGAAILWYFAEENFRYFCQVCVLYYMQVFWQVFGTYNW